MRTGLVIFLSLVFVIMSGGQALAAVTVAATAVSSDGVLTLTSAQGSASAAGNATTITAGAGGATTGVGGAVTFTGGAGTNGNSAGGAASLIGGAGQGSAAGGAAALTGGAAGATGNGGAATITAGAATTGTGGAASLTGGAVATLGTGGAATVTAGASTTSGAGGVASLLGGAGGGTGAGGAVAVTGGAGGATNTTGGAVTIAGGADGGTGTGGAVTIRGGAGDTNGAVSIGATNTASIAIGSSSATTTFGGKASVGTSGSPIDLLTTATNKALEIYSTSASTTAGTSVEPIYMKSTMTGAGGVGGHALFHMYTNVQLGDWANALKGYTEFGASGSVTGLGTAVLAEMKMPGATLTGGNYAPFEAELVFTASGTTGGTPVSFLHAQASGDATALADYRSTGYVMSLQGLGSAASGKIFQANTAAAATHALKILIGSTPYYIMLTDTGT